MVPRPSSIIQILSSFKKLLTPDFFNYLCTPKRRNSRVCHYSHILFPYSKPEPKSKHCTDTLTTFPPIRRKCGKATCMYHTDLRKSKKKC